MNNQTTDKKLLFLADSVELLSTVVKTSPSECKLKCSVLSGSIFIKLSSFKFELRFFEWSFATSVGQGKILIEKIYQLYSNIT